MSKLEQIEKQVGELDSSELTEFRAWFERYDAEAWDRQIESDAEAGKLARLAEHAIRDHQAAGRTSEL